MYLLHGIYSKLKNATFLKVYFFLQLKNYKLKFVFNFNLGRISKSDRAIWSILFKNLATTGLLTNLSQVLVTQNCRIAALWVIELCLIFNKSSNKIRRKPNNNDYMKCKVLHLDTDLVLRTALNAPHAFTMIFLKWSVFNCTR